LGSLGRDAGGFPARRRLRRRQIRTVIQCAALGRLTDPLTRILLTGLYLTLSCLTVNDARNRRLWLCNSPIALGRCALEVGMKSLHAVPLLFAVACATSGCVSSEVRS